MSSAGMGNPAAPPFRTPGFPFAPIAASRAYYWLVDRDPELAKRLAKIVYHAGLGIGRDVASVDVIAELAAPLGIKADELKAARDKLVDRLAELRTSLGSALGAASSGEAESAVARATNMVTFDHVQDAINQALDAAGWRASGSITLGVRSSSRARTTSAASSASSSGGYRGFGIAIVRRPAAFAARIPLWESSTAAARVGATPRRRAASR